jgi:hypothetical protein
MYSTGLFFSPNALLIDRVHVQCEAVCCVVTAGARSRVCNHADVMHRPVYSSGDQNKMKLVVYCDTPNVTQLCSGEFNPRVVLDRVAKLDTVEKLERFLHRDKTAEIEQLRAQLAGLVRLYRDIRKEQDV